MLADTKNSDIFFDQIVSIKAVGEQHVYDLSIEGTRNFIANDIVAHNTYLATSSGNVGIGTTTPDNLLTIRGTDADSYLDVPSILHLNVTDSFNTSLTNIITLDHLLNNPENASNKKAGVDGGIGLGILFRAINNISEIINVSFINATLVNAKNGSEAGALTFYTANVSGIETRLVPRLILNGTDVFIAPTGGNVGIGTAEPGTKLEIAAPGTLSIRGVTGTSGIFPTSGQGLEIGWQGATGTDRGFIQSYDRTGSAWKGMNIDASPLILNYNSAGNVGIGTTSPQNALDIVGAVTVSKGLNASNLNVTGFSIADDSLVTLADGSKKKIKDIKAGEYVQTLDEKTGRIVSMKVNASRDHGVKLTYELATKSGRVINTTGEHPYLVKMYDKELCDKYDGDVWNKEADPFDGYCTRWVEVRDLEENDYIAVPKIERSYSISNNLLMSSVDKVSTSDCSLNLFSLDQIAQSEDNANAKYGISLVCSGNSFKALDSNFLNSDLGTTSSISDNSEKDTINSRPPMPQDLQIFCFNKYNSSNPKSGTINFAPLRYIDLSRFLVKDSGLKNENNTDASTTINLICAAPYEGMPYLLARLSRYSSTSSEKLSSESLLFFNILSTALNNSNTLSLSSTASLNNAFVEGFLSSSPISSLNLSAISTFNSAILLSPEQYKESGYLKLSNPKLLRF